jgi:hypothetical protein
VIDRVHKRWWGDYKKLEAHHGYIQWLFPLFEGGGMNYQSARLTKGEGTYIAVAGSCLALPHHTTPILTFIIFSLRASAKLMRESVQIAMRVVKSYQLMVCFQDKVLLTSSLVRVLSFSSDQHASSISTACVWWISTRAR